MPREFYSGAFFIWWFSENKKPTGQECQVGLGGLGGGPRLKNRDLLGDHDGLFDRRVLLEQVDEP